MYFGFLIWFPPEFLLRCSQFFQQSVSRALFCLLLDREGEKEALAESRQAFKVTLARIELVNLIFSRQIGFSTASTFVLIYITMIVTDPAVQDFLLLGLGFCILVYFIFHPGQKSRFWPCDVVMRKKEGHWGGEWPDLCSLSWVWQNQTSERNALLPGCYSR